MAATEVTHLIRSLLEEVGEDPSRDGLIDTPKRVAKAYVDAVSGYGTTACSIIGSAVFHEPLVSCGSGGMVLVRDIDFAATCDRTLMPFHGQCHVAYVPTRSSILGLSKLARLVHAFSKRLCSPDGLSRQLAEAIDSSIPCSGVYVQISAKHLAEAAMRRHAFAESYTGLFDQPRSLHLKEVRMLIRPRARDTLPLSQTGTSLGSLHFPSTPDPPSHVHNSIATKVVCIYSTLLRGTGCSLQPAAAEAYSRVFLRQTSGYSQTLGGILAQHLPTPGPAAVTPGARPVLRVVGDGIPSPLLADARMQDDSSVSTTCVAATEAADDSSSDATSSGMRSCRGTADGGGAHADAAAGSGHRRQLAELRCTCDGRSGASSGSNTPLSDHDRIVLGGSSKDAAAQPRAWRTAVGGRVRCLDMSTGDRCGTLAAETLQALDSFYSSNRRGAVAAGSGCEGLGGEALQLWSVDFATQCEHHILPFYGTLHVVLPGGGRSGMLTPALVCDIVDMYALRLQVQERLTHQVADALYVATGDAVLVVCSAAHMCMVARGVEKHAAETMTTATRGWLEQDELCKSVWLERLLESISS